MKYKISSDNKLRFFTSNLIDFLSNFCFSIVLYFFYIIMCVKVNNFLNNNEVSKSLTVFVILGAIPVLITILLPLVFRKKIIVSNNHIIAKRYSANIAYFPNVWGFKINYNDITNIKMFDGSTPTNKKSRASKIRYFTTLPNWNKTVVIYSKDGLIYYLSLEKPENFINHVNSLKNTSNEVTGTHGDG